MIDRLGGFGANGAALSNHIDINQIKSISQTSVEAAVDPDALKLSQ